VVDRSGSWNGDSRFAIIPSPIWPPTFHPQQKTPPSPARAQLW